MFNFCLRPAFGLDLGDLSLKIVQFKKKGTKVFLSSFVKEDIPAGLIQRGEVQKEEELISVLKNSLSKTKGEPLKGKRVVCNLPEEKIFLRIIQLPIMKREELREAVKWEAEAHIPLSLKEVYLDWHVIKPVFNHLDHFDVLIAATPRELVDSYLSFLRKSGLEPVALEPESTSAVRSLIKPEEIKPSIIVDLGTTGTNFVIFSSGAIRFSARESHISGQVLSQAIAEKMKITESKANQLKIDVGLDNKKDSIVFEALSPIVDELANKIEEYISFYHNHATHIHGPEGKIEHVILCGGDSLLINLIPFLKKKINLAIESGNPFVNLPKTESNNDNGISLDKREELSSVVAVGLALREVIVLKND